LPPTLLTNSASNCAFRVSAECRVSLVMMRDCNRCTRAKCACARLSLSLATSAPQYFLAFDAEIESSGCDKLSQFVPKRYYELSDRRNSRGASRQFFEVSALARSFFTSSTSSARCLRVSGERLLDFSRLSKDTSSLWTFSCFFPCIRLGWLRHASTQTGMIRD
jgi:hypothetical protein